MKAKLKQNLFSLFKLFMAVGLIYWLVQKGYLESRNLIKLLEPKFLILGLALVGLNILTTGVRWFILINEKGFKLSLSKVLPLHLIGVFFNFALPAGSVGGDMVKGYYIVRGNPQRKLEAGVTVLMDRVIGLYAMLVMGLLSIAWNYQLIKTNSSLMALSSVISFVFFGVTMVLLFSLSERVFKFSDSLLQKIPLGEKILKVYEGIHSYRNHKSGLLKAFAISFLAQVFIIFFFVLMGEALGESEIPLGTYFFAVPIGLIATALPLSQGGVGVGQVALLYLFELATGHKYDVGQTGVTLMQILMFAWGIYGAYFYIRFKKQMVHASVSGEAS